MSEQMTDDRKVQKMRFGSGIDVILGDARTNKLFQQNSYVSVPVSVSVKIKHMNSYFTVCTS